MIQIQRVAEHKNGWKLRYGDANGLIATIIVESSSRAIRLPEALRKGADAAEQRFEVMKKFNSAARKQ